MSQRTAQKAAAVELPLCCPRCGAGELSSIEQLRGGCSGHAALTIAPDGQLRTQFHPGGFTDVDWGSWTTVGVRCRACLWAHEGAGHLAQLTAAIAEDH